MSVQIHLNGERFDLPEPRTVAELLEHLDLRPEQVAVEVNEALVPRDRRGEIVLQLGDRVEFVTLVGGG